MAQYFDNEKLDSKMENIEVKFLDKTFTFITDKGVFSRKKLDFGTRFLLETIYPRLTSGSFLDVGCGYGVITIILSNFIDGDFEGIDINRRAVHLSKMNKKLNKCNKVNFYESNIYDNVNKKYDYIITNPPIRAGKDVVYDILRDAKKHLNSNGKLYYVMRKSHGVMSSIKFLSDYYSINILGKSKGFYIIECFFVENIEK